MLRQANIILDLFTMLLSEFELYLEHSMTVRYQQKTAILSKWRLCLQIGKHVRSSVATREG